MFARIAIVIVLLAGAAAFIHFRGEAAPVAAASSESEAGPSASASSAQHRSNADRAPHEPSRADIIRSLEEHARHKAELAKTHPLPPASPEDPNAPGSALGDPAAQIAQGTVSREHDPAKVTPEEQAVIALYENMATAFDTKEASCAEIAVAVSEFIEESRADIVAFSKARASMQPAERAEAQARIEREASDELTRLRQSMRSGLAKCPQEERLQEAIRKLAELGQ